MKLADLEKYIDIYLKNYKQLEENLVIYLENEISNIEKSILNSNNVYNNIKLREKKAMLESKIEKLNDHFINIETIIFCLDKNILTGNIDLYESIEKKLKS
jgi:5'(3')-deoxyribonucleotidase